MQIDSGGGGKREYHLNILWFQMRLYNIVLKIKAEFFINQKKKKKKKNTYMRSKPWKKKKSKMFKKNQDWSCIYQNRNE